MIGFISYYKNLIKRQMNFKYSLTDKNGYTNVAIIGKFIEQHQADELLYDIEHHLLSDKNKFVIDLSQLEFINQNGFSVLVKILTLARKNGGDVILSDLSEALLQNADGKKLEQVFTSSENEFLAAALLN